MRPTSYVMYMAYVSPYINCQKKSQWLCLLTCPCQRSSICDHCVTRADFGSRLLPSSDPITLSSVLSLGMYTQSLLGRDDLQTSIERQHVGTNQNYFENNISRRMNTVLWHNFTASCDHVSHSGPQGHGAILKICIGTLGNIDGRTYNFAINETYSSECITWTPHSVAAWIASWQLLSNDARSTLFASVYSIP